MTTKKEIEMLVEKILETNGVKTTPIPVEDIARRESILISQAESKSFSGVLLRKSGVAFIALNSKESPVRQRFTLAHELGHYFLHPNKNTFIEFRDNKNKEEVIRSHKEIEANKFAAAMLMPKKLLLKDIVAFSDSGVSENHLTFLANKYQVSEKAMSYRLINLNS